MYLIVEIFLVISLGFFLPSKVTGEDGVLVDQELVSNLNRLGASTVLESDLIIGRDWRGNAEDFQNYVVASNKFSVITIDNEKISPALLCRLRETSNLRALILGDKIAIDDQTLATIVKNSNLRDLRFSGAAISDHGFEQLSGCSLTTLIARNCTKLTDTGIAALRNVAQLESLTIHANLSNGSGLDRLTTLPLRHLTLDLPLATEEALSSLSKFVGLESLEILNAKASCHFLQNFRSARTLTHLRLNFTTADARTFSSLGHFPKLATLHVSNSTVRENDMASIGKIDGLKVLSLADSKLTDETLRHLAAMPHLQQLFLDRTSIDGTGLRYLRGLDLSYLGLQGIRPNVAGLSILTGMELDNIDIRGMSITDGDLVQFLLNTRSSAIVLCCRSLNDEQLDAVQSERPDLRVEMESCVGH